MSHGIIILGGKRLVLCALTLAEKNNVQNLGFVFYFRNTKLLKSWEVYALVVAGQVVKKEVVTEIRKVPPKMFSSVV